MAVRLLDASDGGLPTVPGAAFHAAYLPVSDRGEIGGDWYDAFELPGGRVAVGIGDVAGRGSYAAALMGEVRHAIRTAAVARSATPSDVLDSVNELLRSRESTGLVTGIFGIYDPEKSTLAYAVAGHPPPLLSLAGGVTRRLPSGGLPLGCTRDLDAVTWTFTIPAGARAVLYTNGLVGNDRKPIEGEERLLDVVRQLHSTPACDPAEAALRRIFDGAANRDDAAVLILERTASVKEYVFSAQPVVSPLARAIVDRVLDALPISEEKRFGVLVAVGEAIANAVEHAYRDATPGLIRLRIDVQSLQLIVTIEDFGCWRPFVRREEGGRGIELMHAFMDGVQIKSRRDSTAVVLKARFGAAESAPEE